MILYKTITGVTNPTSVTVSRSHSSSTALALIECVSSTLELGDYIEVDMGYTDEHGILFKGYVKSIEQNYPDGTYTISANDKLIRALDYFIVPSNPAQTLKYRNITAESLVINLMALAGLTDIDYDATSFTFGVSNEFEILQISVYDYCKNISELLTWSLWCDKDGTINFKNRKPFVMTGSEPQPGWSNDTPITSYTWEVNKTLEFMKHKDEKNLRNRVVVWGANGVYAEAKDDDSPYFHWKTAVLGSVDVIDTTETAQKTADYNLHLFNRLTEKVTATVVGNINLNSHSVVTINFDPANIIGENYYIYSSEHRISDQGYTTTMELVK